MLQGNKRYICGKGGQPFAPAAETTYMNLINFRNISCFLPAVFRLLCFALIFAGCATPEDVNRTQYDINLLNAEVKDIKEKISSPLQKEELDRNLQEIQGTQESTAKTVSDLLIQFQSLSAEFRILTGRFEESRYYSEKNYAEMKAEKEKLAAQLKDMELAIDDLKKRVAPAEKIEETKDVQGSEKKETGMPEGKKEVQKADVKDAYMAGYQVFKEGKTAEAREKLTSLLKDYPGNEYSDNARFWIAESYYKDKQYEDAILAYEELLKKNPKSDKAPGALWKQGLSFYALKDDKTGRIILEKLIDQFPKSEQALLAKKKIGKTIPPKKK